MSNPIPTESFKFTEARAQLSSIADRVFRREARVIIYKGSTPVAAIVSIADLERLEAYDRARAERFAEMEHMSRPFADIPPDVLEAEIAKAIAEVRAEQSALVTP